MYSDNLKPGGTQTETAGQIHYIKRYEKQKEEPPISSFLKRFLF